ncbi:VOC family protein [Paenibacillus sp. DMB20]|uniref:VOC family protein n=1 Tax=Paenibacillus sp. DMB20 TaxID=1642570 RepID=UPI0006277AF0|nr:VOC family protein [Paenibacillus sp. DMB20]KKO51360.1 3-demethylubiquinone-9 3-methyltransferase [Paenibacillus sp. DMB20]
MTLKVTPLLQLNGNTREAIQFYQKTLDAEVIAFLTYGEMPMDLPAEYKEMVAHAVIKVGQSDIMFSDSPFEPLREGDQVSICISTDDIEESKRIFNSLQQGGNVVMPLEATSFSPSFGTLTDRFGIRFTIVTADCHPGEA